MNRYVFIARYKNDDGFLHACNSSPMPFVGRHAHIDAVRAQLRFTRYYTSAVRLATESRLDCLQHDDNDVDAAVQLLCVDTKCTM